MINTHRESHGSVEFAVAVLRQNTHAPSSATFVPSGDLAAANRFYVTVAFATDQEVARGVEILSQDELERCRTIVAVALEEAGLAVVTGYSLRGYEQALENARRFASRRW